MFDSVKQSEFDSFAQNVSGSIARLEEAIHQQPADLVARAQKAATDAEAILKNLSELQENGQTQAALAKSQIQAIETATGTIQATATDANAYNTQLIALTEKCKDLLVEIEKLKEQSEQITGNISAKQTDLAQLLESSAALAAKVDASTKQLSVSTDNAAKIKSTLTQSLEHSDQIRRLRDEVFGTDEVGANGSITRIEGTVDRLKNAHNELQSAISGLQKTVDDAVGAISVDHERRSKSQQEAFDAVINNATKENDTVVNRLKELLPGSMAAGLSSAYRAKQRVEAKSLKKLEFVFGWCIGLMTLAAAVPLAINLFITHGSGSGVESFLKFIPSLMIPMLPIYLPIFWLAYSTNKKINLSKRLIEEYTHKLVLGKTFAALTHQIQGLAGKDDVYHELQTRLLFNILQMSAENPGKLITNYSKADHPMMEALESSEKLSSAVDALEKIPGFSALANRLAKNVEAKVAEAEEKVKAGFAAADRLTESLPGKPASTQ